jgi:hypothetical protein
MSAITDAVDLNISRELGTGGWRVSITPTVNGVACVDYADATLTTSLGETGYTVTYTEDGCQDE